MTSTNMRCRVRGRTLPAMLLASSAFSAGCLPWPVPITYVTTPEVRGRLVDADGEPVAGGRVAVARSWRHPCQNLVTEAPVDEAGRFVIPQITERHRWLPLMENPGGGVAYYVCLGTGSEAPIYTSVADVNGKLAGDTLECMTWEWRERPQLTCEVMDPGGSRPLMEAYEFSGRRMLGVGSRDIWIRVEPILEDPDAETPTELVVQWLTAPEPDDQRVIVALAELPIDRSILDPGWYSVRNQRVGNSWEISVPTTRKSFWSGAKRVRFGLGEPGQVWLASPIPDP